MSPPVATLGPQVCRVLVDDLAPDHGRGRHNPVQGLVRGVSGASGPALAVRLRGHLTPLLDGRSPAEAADGTMPA